VVGEVAEGTVCLVGGIAGGGAMNKVVSTFTWL
jgi:hypothetical protein